VLFIFQNSTRHRRITVAQVFGFVKHFGLKIEEY